MFIIALVICMFGSSVASIKRFDKIHYNMANSDMYFQHFMKTYSRRYDTPHEKKMRFEIFKKTLEKINHRNALHSQLVFGINKFSDLTSDEFQSKYTGIRTKNTSVKCKNAKLQTMLKNKKFPKSFDWRDLNKVTRVKDQDLCGACYTFSTTGNIEGQYAILHNKLVEFSEQQLVDCDNSNGRCYGGWMSNSLQHLRTVGGVMTEVDYYYKGKVGSCRFDKRRIRASVLDCLDFSLKSEQELVKALADFGPLSITVWSESWRIYTGGVMLDCERDPNGEVDHAALLVGYGSENGTDFWTIKNSWGEEWGEQGYVRIRRNVNACNLMSRKGQIVSAVLG